MQTRPALATLLLVATLLTAACTGGEGDGEGEAASRGGASSSDGPPPIDPANSLTDAGLALYAASTPQERPRPRYDVEATFEPTAGDVHGTLTAELPAVPGDELTFRFFPGLPAFEAEPRIGDVEVDGRPVPAELDASILRVPVAEVAGRAVRVVIPFGYTLPEHAGAGLLDGLTGDGLDPAAIGLLARHPDVLSLGHWMPLWIPEGRRADPVPDGYGDIGNFPAADVRARLDVPVGWSVVDSGVHTEESEEDGRHVVTSEGAGMRDFMVSVLRDHRTSTRELDGELEGVTIAATAPEAQADQLDVVLDETEAALRTLSEELTPYPWREFDVVSAPLGASVGGMEWPGATWIESGLFGGGVPGLGDLAGELDLDGAVGDALGDLGIVLETLRAWTIAHEAAHSWWTVVVGNDSIEDPVVDEPLAQYSACLVLRASVPRGDEACRAQIGSGYSEMRMVGVPDARADQATDEFESSVQYGGVVYGKAAQLYLALESEFGDNELAGALRAVVERHAFQTIAGRELESALRDELGAGASQLWSRWMERTNGDQDLDPGS